MSDSFTEVTHTSWLSRIKSAIGGVFFGLILIIAGIILLSWNEGRTIKQKRALNEGKNLVVSISSTGIDGANEGKLVHLSDMANTDNILNDAVFGISSVHSVSHLQNLQMMIMMMMVVHHRRRRGVGEVVMHDQWHVDKRRVGWTTNQKRFLIINDFMLDLKVQVHTFVKSRTQQNK